MHYYEWNNLIGDLLFSPAKAGQPVLLYLTRKQITQAALDAHYFETEDEAWDCFTRRLQNWFNTKRELTLVDCIKKAQQQSQRITVGEISYETRYPVCLGLLVVSVLPLTDEATGFVSAADYYNRAGAFMRQHGLPGIPAQNQTDNWNEAWQLLQTWANTKKRGSLGQLRVSQSFDGHVYVGKPFSQCLIPPAALRDMPRAFVRAGWVPKQALTANDWQSLLANYCYDIGFRQAALRTLGTKEGMDYAQPILQTRFDQWDGTSHTAAKTVALPMSNIPINKNKPHQPQKETTFARFCLSFPDLDDMDGVFDWHYRVKGAQPLPDVLHLLGQTFQAQSGDWSSAVRLPFQERLSGEDTTNKWAVSWPDEPIRLFISGQWHGLNSRVWVETNELSRTHTFYAICQPTHVDILRNWGRSFVKDDFDEYIPDEDFDATGWPTGYGLFCFRKATRAIPGTRFGLPTTQRLEWVGGLKTAYHEYLNRHYPYLHVVNSDGSIVPVVFTENGQQINLTQRTDNPAFFELPEDVPTDVSLNAYIHGQTDQLTARFVQADIDALPAYVANIPCRDSLGNANLPADVPCAFRGLDVQRTPADSLSFLKLRHIFFPAPSPQAPIYQPRQDNWSLGDDLLTYLTARRECRTNDFLSAYETLLMKAVEQGQIELPVNVARSRRWSLGWYDTLGYIDYEYDLGCIRTLPTMLVPVPCKRGHRAILVGGRSPQLLEQIRQAAAKTGVVVSVENQSEPTYLAPSVIALYSAESFYKDSSPITQVAQQLGIPYLTDELPAWRLLERSGSLTDYRATLQPEPEAEAKSWTLRVFNPDRLCFERPTTTVLDTTFTLVERQLNAYQFAHYLWIDGQSYRVDKNWGRFLVLHHQQRQVIFRREQHNQIVIPATLPLPRVLARGFALLSGKIPVREEHNFDGTRRAYLLYENAGNILSGNYIQKTGQQLQSTSR